MKPESVSFIGAGNLAWHLAPTLDNVGYAVREVYSKKRRNAIALAEKLYQCEVIEDLDFSDSPSRIFIISITDDAIEEVVGKIRLPAQSLVVHTSGSKSISVLEKAKANTGVFYPLQTFTKNRKIQFDDIPIFVESADASSERRLMAMGKSISKKVTKISSEERKVLHLAAVFAANFSNHMLTLSKEVMFKHGLSFDYLKPLIAETLNKSLQIGPENAQTGPARRGDLQILDSHMELLKEDPDVAEIYRTISQHIVTSYSDPSEE
jgi:predicted short-subunit dehydrogenase-like oxidoreductase (DUF2520 family)